MSTPSQSTPIEDDDDSGMSTETYLEMAHSIARSHGWCLEGHKSCDKWPDCTCPGFLYYLGDTEPEEQKANTLAPKDNPERQ
jgi:hypothetical protein